MNVFSHNSRRKLLLSLLLFLDFPLCSGLLTPKSRAGSSCVHAGPALGVFSLNACTSEPWFHPHKSYSEGMFLFHCAPTSVSVLFPVSNRSICCSSMVPGTQPSIPPWSVQKSWKSKRSAFTPATSKKSSRLGSASETEALVWWSSCVQSTLPTLPFPLC